MSEQTEPLNLYSDAWKFLWKMRNIQGSAALMTLEKYINGALIQHERIRIDKRNVLNVKAKTRTRLLALAHTLSLDIHFYFICLDKCRSLFKFISENESDLEILNLWNQYKKDFQFCRDARNHLEHIEERISDKRYLRDLGNLIGDSFTFGGKSFDIGERKLKIFIGAYEELLSVLQKKLRIVNAEGDIENAAG